MSRQAPKSTGASTSASTSPAPGAPTPSDPVSRPRTPSEGDGRRWYEVQVARPVNVDGALRHRGRPFRTTPAIAAPYGDTLKPTAGEMSEYTSPSLSKRKSKPSSKSSTKG